MPQYLRPALLATLLPMMAAITPLPAADEAPDALALLDDSRERLLTEIGSVTDEQAHWKPAPDRWSILECLEHIVLAEATITGILQDLGSAAPPPADAVAATDAELTGLATDRSRRFEAPDAIRPSGRWTSLEEALAAFEAGRAETRAAVAALGERHPDRRALNPALGKWLDGYQWSLLASGHVVRHSLQIREVRESPGFPAP